MPKRNRRDEENPEWTVDEIRRARPLMDVLPRATADAVRRYRGQRGPQKKPTKELISIRIDRDVVAALRATGAGWQKRANEALRAYTKKRGLEVTAQLNAVYSSKKSRIPLALRTLQARSID